MIRGNASEIISLSSGAASGRGVDSTAATDNALDAAQVLALKTQAIVAVTGATNYVTDGKRVIALSATVAAFVGADGVHVSQRDLPADVTRKMLGPDALIGLSVSNLAEAEAADRFDGVVD